VTREQRVANSGPTLTQVNAGFDSRFHDGNWVPVHVTLDNNGSDFQGTVSVSAANAFSNNSTASNYQVPVSLPQGAHKQVTLYVPFSFGTQGNVQNATVSLLDTSGKTVTSQSTSLRTLNTTDLFVGVLSNQSGTTSLSNVQLPSTSSAVVVQPLDATTLPDNSLALKNFNLIVLDNFNTATLSQQQVSALRSWIVQGGSLLVAGGPEWQQTLKPLPADLLPVSPTGATTLAANTSLLPIGGPTTDSKTGNGPASSIPVSTASVTRGTSILLSGTTPLIVQAHVGQGTIVYTAFDPMLNPVSSWSGASILWRSLLFRTVGEQAVLNSSANFTPSFSANTTNTFSDVNLAGLLQILLPNTAPSIVFILVLLLAYILILGPGRLILVRFLKKRDWSWRIALITIVLFSLLSYGLAVLQKGTTIISDSISVVQLAGASSTSDTAHITTYQGVFVPNQGDYTIHMPQANFVQPYNGETQYGGPFQASQLAGGTTITPSSNATDTLLHGVNIWTLRSMVSERDQQLHGGITSTLVMSNRSLRGTVTNTLPYALSDVYVLVGGQYANIGSLASGQTAQVSISAVSTFDPTSPSTIADQIANANGQGTNNSSYTNNTSQPQNSFQRHVTIMSALSNPNTTYCVNGSCYGQSSSGGPSKVVNVTSNGSSQTIVMNGNSSTQFRYHDPLAIANAPATLIGWADASAQSDILGDVTVNNTPITGHQEILIQAPLPISYAGSVSLDSTQLPGQLVDVQGSSTQYQNNGIYTMNGGSVTYEYASPNLSHVQNGTFTLSEFGNLTQMLSQSGGTTTSLLDANHLQVRVYNWQKQSWDTFSFTQFGLSLPNARSYVSSSGQVLVQLSNPSSTQTIAFNKPVLSLQGSVSQ
jgi:uncharacterized membrane protein YhaH (DUF805 family)